MTFPQHKGGLHLEHNPHKGYYMTAAKHLTGHFENYYEFADDDARRRCVETDELWTLQWYPETPIGFLAVAAPTLDELLALANSGKATM